MTSPSDGSATVIVATWLYVCPTHGVLSERESDEAYEMGTDYWGEACEPYGCPLSVRVPVPTTADRTRPPQKFVRITEGAPPPTFGPPWTDPGWTHTECWHELEHGRFVRTDS